MGIGLVSDFNWILPKFSGPSCANTFPMRRKLFQRQKIYFSKPRQTAENFNLGPLKDLDGLIDEVIALDSAKSYLRKQVIIERTVTGDLNKSADLATFQKKSETSHVSQHPFGYPAPNRGWKLHDMIEVIHGYLLSICNTDQI